MIISSTKTVRELATEVPGASRVFEKLGIDYCCGGSKSLEAACTTAGVVVEDVVKSLKQTENRQGKEFVNWQKDPLSRLVSYIVEKHHIFTKEELERLTRLLGKICSVHGKNHPELLRIERLFRDLKEELLSHMYKEEQILFPFIAMLEEAIKQNRPAPMPPFRTLQNPIRMMLFEHDDAGEMLRKIRQASSDFSVPADGCVSYKTLYQALEAFEKDLHEHIHLENNILFPRAIEMEG